MPHDHPLKDQELPHFGGNLDLEIARLTSLERGRIEQAGSLFPERENELENFEHVLDIMSGTGVWALSAAQLYPEIEVLGLEFRSRLVDYARGLTEARKVGNVSYSQLKESLTRLPFPDNFFDMLNANYLFLMLQSHEWPLFFQECLRVTRPGGYIRVIEQDWGMTNSPAIEKLSDLFLRSLKKANLGLSPNGRSIGVLPLIGPFLQRAGWVDIQRRVIIDDYLNGPGVPHNTEQAVRLMANAMRDITIRQHMATSAEYDALISQAVIEMEREDFCSSLLFVVFVARKPELAR